MNPNLLQMREYIAKDKPKTIRKDFAFKEPLQHGWLLRYLLPLEMFAWGRWEHWTKLMTAQALIAEPIPHIDFSGAHARSPGRKALETALNATTSWGSWQGWGSFSTFDYFLEWLLFGFGDPSQKELPPIKGNVDKEASERLYQVFNLEPLIAYPYDYFGDILAENHHGRAQGFYPTPIDVCTMMVQMQMEGEDMRDKSVCDPALGTGRMLLVASNYSYRLYGNDVNETVLKACKVNGYLYAPWLVKSFAFLETREKQPRAEITLPAPEIKPVKPQMEMELV